MLSLKKGRNNPRNLKSDELIGELLSWEITLNKRKKEREATQGEEKKKIITIKATTSSKKEKEEESSSNDEEDSDDEKLTLITRKPSKYIKKFDYKKKFKRGSKSEVT